MDDGTKPEEKTKSARPCLREWKWALIVAVVTCTAAAFILPWLPKGQPPVPGGRRARADIASIENAVSQFRVEYGRFPDSLDGLLSPPPLNGTVGGPEEALLKRLPVDPWGGPYFCSIENRRVLIRSAGPDKVLGTQDDISNSEPEPSP